MGHLAALVDVVDGLDVDFAVVAFAVTRIGEIETAVAIGDDVIGTVELLPLEGFGEHRDLSFEIGAGETAGASFAGDEGPGWSEKEPVRLAARFAVGCCRPAGGVVDHDTFVRNVGEVDLAIGREGGTLGEFEITGELAEGRALFHERAFVGVRLRIGRAVAGLFAEILNPDIPIKHLECFLAVADAMDLQGDEAGRGHVVLEVGGGDAVDEGADAVADRFDSVMVPVVLFEGISRSWIVGKVVEPAAAAFVVDATAPASIGGIDLDLVAVDLSVLVIGEAVRADLDAAVQGGIDLVFDLEDEVRVELVGAKKGIRRLGNGRADDHAVFNGVFGNAAPLGPAVEILAIEEIDPFARLGGRERRRGQGERNEEEGRKAGFHDVANGD